MKKGRMTNEFRLDFARHDWTEIDSYLRPCQSYKKGRSGIEYLQLSTAFDIESTSFFRHKASGRIINTKQSQRIARNKLANEWEKIAIMYAWVFAYDGHAFTGRTWEEFELLLNRIIEYHGLGEKRIMVCGIHNLSYEFQFMRFRFVWSSIFAIRERVPLYARTDTGIEFRCTLLLSGYSLAKVGENLQRYHVEKKIGDLDYLKLRHCETPLTDAEWGYIVNDGLVACAYLQEAIEDAKRIVWLPLTKTGYVRKYLRHKCYFTKSDHVRDYEHKYARYRRVMESCIIGSPEEYEMLKLAFTGAIVHCNTYYSGLLVEDVQSMDETSAYPTQIAIGFFPYGRGVWTMPKDKKEFEYLIAKKACLMDVSFFDIEKSQQFESLISRSKCINEDRFEEDNGRLIRADMIRIVITEVDYAVYKKFYKWKRLKIHRMMVYEKRRLPSEFVDAVLDLYATKTKLKGVEGKESEYLHAKENINSCYGACVTDICRDTAVYENGVWTMKKCDVQKELDRYNKSKSRFLAYQWGVWITSLSRRALASAIYAIGKESDTECGDYIYSDTDSVKYRNPEKHKDYFIRYNEYMMNELKKASEYHKIPIEKFMPKTIKGEVKPLGVWDFDGNYKRFKSLGAKRYAVEYEDGHHSITIAGVNKRRAIPYIEAHEKDFFDFMHFDYEFVEDCCGKNLHTYIDERMEGELTDYLGNVAHFEELSSVHLMETTYKMTASDDYLHLLDSIIDSMTYID